MMNKLSAIATAAVLAVFLATGAGAKTFKAADTHSDGYPTVEAVKYMGKLLESWTNGRMKIKMFPGRQLGEEKDTIEQTIFGAIDLMAPKGMIGLAYYDSGARSFYNAKRPIRSPADMKGMKIRVQNSDLFVSMMSALGANATPMEFGQVYEALKTGVVDGAENNWPSYETTRHFEVAKHYTLDQHSMSPEVLVMSKKTWDGLGTNDRILVRKAAALSVPEMRRLWNARVAKSRSLVMKAGNKVIEKVNKQPFIDAMKPVYAKFAPTANLKDMVKRIQAVK